MRPDFHFAMRTALALGPAHCPADLFAGPIDRVLLGLKAHANTISNARHVALEDTFPRTRDRIGAERFHALAANHLERADILSLPIAEVGCSFADALAGQARDLARLEWAWLQSHGAADQPAFDLAAVADLAPEEAIAVRVVRHVAVRLLEIAHPIEFDGTRFEPPLVMVTRSAIDVTISGASRSAADLLGRLQAPVSLGDLLDIDPAATTQLIVAGALAPALEAIA